MKLPLALVALIFTAGLLRADIVIVQKVDGGGGQTGEMTVKVSGDKVRTDVSKQVSTITDATTGDITTLMHERKTYMVISAAAGKAMLAQMTKMMHQAGTTTSGTMTAPVATGKTDKINGFNATEYAFNNGIIKASYWMSTDFPNAKAVSEALAKFRKGSLADMTKAFSPDLSALPGVPVKTEMQFDGHAMTTELVSATEGPIDASEFQVPADYTKMEMPTMPQQ